MGKLYETSTVFNYTWDQLIRAFWLRYPNPFSRHVISEDTLHREVRGGGGELYSRRLLTKTSRLPKWAEKFMKSNQVPIVEESLINLNNKTLTTYTRNIAYARILSVSEKVTYSVDPSDPERTVARRSAWIDSSMVGFRMAIESLGLKGYIKHCKQAVQGFEHVLYALNHRGNAGEGVPQRNAQAKANLPAAGGNKGVEVEASERSRQGSENHTA